MIFQPGNKDTKGLSFISPKLRERKRERDLKVVESIKF